MPAARRARRKLLCSVTTFKDLGLSAPLLDALKEDLAQRKALDLVTESAKPVAAEAATSS